MCNLWLILAVLFWGVFDCLVTWVRKVTQKLFSSVSPFLTYVPVSLYFEEIQLEVHNICFHTLCVFYDIVQFFSNLHCDFFFYLCVIWKCVASFSKRWKFIVIFLLMFNLILLRLSNIHCKTISVSM